NTLEAEWLSTDEAIVQEYQADPLVQRTTTPRWFIEVEAAQKMLVRHAPEVTTPLLMLLGEDDKVADHTLARTVFDLLGSADKELQIYAGLRHEVFNERARHRVFSDVVGWLKQRSTAAQRSM
ncbi:MAG TPA: alpha/beta hydrolase, partial [Thermoanaerobaculia bacterium]|nr:alpha/beta hydrolase [Thermoanaerobaculia bacterium]